MVAHQNRQSNGIKNKSRLKGIIILSLALTPFIIFGITSAELYLINRMDLDNRIIVLLPFAVLFLVTMLLGYGFYRYRYKHQVVKALLLAYYMAGPVFLLYTLIQPAQLSPTLKGTILFWVFLLGVTYIYRKFELAKVTGTFAWIALVLIAGQAVIIANTLGAFSFGGVNNPITQNWILNQNMNELPNIYHLVLDEFQTEMFELTLTEEVREELGGFVYYPENTTIYGKTGMSFASLFSGVMYNPETSKGIYERNAINSQESLLFWLKEAGYNTRAYVHRFYPSGSRFFDKTIDHSENTSTDLNNNFFAKLFFDLWVHTNMPNKIAALFIDAEFLYQIKENNLLPDIYPVAAYESFSNIIEDKSTLDKPNTYTLIHLVLPHVPYVLRSNCSYDDTVMGESFELAALEQSECAMKLTVDFLNVLKELGRYDDSLIIIQSDHGARFKIKGEALKRIRFIEEGEENEEWSWARARTLLLIKTPDRGDDDLFIISTEPTTLLDVAPTITWSTGIRADIDFEGVPLKSPETVISNREYRPFLHPKKNRNGCTIGYYRYFVSDEGIKFNNLIPINHDCG